MKLPPTPPLYFEDLSIGQTFSSSPHTIDAEQIKAFASQFDPQPFHLDSDKARDSIFGELVASGWHTAAISMRLLVESTLHLAGGTIGAGGEVQWPIPTRPGDTLRIEGVITEITPSRSRPDRGMVTVKSQTINQRGEVAQIFTAKLVVTRRPS